MASGITETDVWKAADSLLLEGQRPTIERVRQKIGRGSPNTVQPYLDTWFKGLGARIKDPQAFAAPPGAPEPIAQAATHFWQVALAEARASFHAEQELAQQELAEEREVLKDQSQNMAAREAAFEARIEALGEALRNCEAQLTDCRTREQHVQSIAATLDRRNRELLAELSAARTQADANREAFDRERRETNERAALQEQHWLNELDRQRQVVKDSTQRLREAEKRGSAAVEALQDKLSTAERSTDALRGTIQALSEQLERAQTEKAGLDLQVQSLQTRVEDEAHQASTLRGALDEARKQIRQALLRPQTVRRPLRSVRQAP